MVIENQLKYFIVFSDTTSWMFFQLLRKPVARIFPEKMKKGLSACSAKS